MTLNEEPERSSTAPRPRERRWPLFSLAAALVIVGWLVAQFWPASKPDTGSKTYNLIAVGAVPWFLQWAGLSCAILGCCRSGKARDAAKLAIEMSSIFATIWWAGLVWRFWGMTPLNATIDHIMFGIASVLGNSAAFDEILFNHIGPIVGMFQLRGPFELQGWNFLSAVLSTGLLLGYLLLVWRLGLVGARVDSAMSYLKIFAAVLPLALLPFVKPGINDLHRSWSRARFENNVRRVVSGVPLQQWATNLLARPSPNGWETGQVAIAGVGKQTILRTRTTASELGTDFPSALLGLDGAPPMITIWQGTTNLPGWVTLTWTNAETGRWGFHVGPTNFDPRPILSIHQSDPWQAGVYFWRSY